ncbi:MAG: ketopantoate reductase C-terminal domain-containing protein [Candidatus Paceibacterota bacterium]|nr:ketopantoate reductase C-terminal domain-containing protein [Candidatus Paceibacterota bacterium]MDD4830708.1 ketopantoate reductase C-terminal domain-containing protein [Candidatus Paceibacterota bacterium]MDD4875143.1 ketopantoate reductase C-terminal domain-containing protein [Candidatus Paceibacterota bacterium]
MQKIAIVGIGGRTGTLFAEQFKKSAKILGIAKEKEASLIRTGKLLIQKKGEDPKVFKSDIIEDKNFSAQAMPDYILVSTRYPIYPVVKYYYQIVKQKDGKIPALIISQNGLEAFEEAMAALREIFKEEVFKVQVIRLNLFNAVDGTRKEDKFCLKYFEPVRLVFSSAFGPIETGGFKKILEKSGTEFKEYPREEFKNMEYSKLFLNLIGMASASWSKSVKEGFKSRIIFKEEAESLREYITAVKLSGGSFLNFKHYPVSALASIINITPMPLLLVFRSLLGEAISRGRGNKPKDLSEAEYYNGAVIKLARKFGAQAPMNAKIYNKIKKIK